MRDGVRPDRFWASMIIASSIFASNSPVSVLAGANSPTSFTPNQAPNSFVSAIARQTRDTGALMTTSFSILSVLMCNLLVAYYQVTENAQPFSCTFGGPNGRTLIR